MRHNAVFAIFKTRMQLEDAVARLKAEGFRSSDISALFPHGDSTRQFAHEKGTKAPEGAIGGAGAGAAVGGAFGWLVGIGLLVIPGLGPFIAAGPIVAALAGVGVGGAVGGLTGALVGLGIPEYEAKRYEGFVKDGGTLLSIHADNRVWAKKAKAILRDCGAIDVASHGEAKADIKAHHTH